jgi:hypothetical protein
MYCSTEGVTIVYVRSPSSTPPHVTVTMGAVRGFVTVTVEPP